MDLGTKWFSVARAERASGQNRRVRPFYHESLGWQILVLALGSAEATSKLVPTLGIPDPTLPKLYPSRKKVQEPVT